MVEPPEALPVLHDEQGTDLILIEASREHPAKVKAGSIRREPAEPDRILRHEYSRVCCVIIDENIPGVVDLLDLAGIVVELHVRVPYLELRQQIKKPSAPGVYDDLYCLESRHVWRIDDEVLLAGVSHDDGDEIVEIVTTADLIADDSRAFTALIRLPRDQGRGVGLDVKQREEEAHHVAGEAPLGAVGDLAGGEARGGDVAFVELSGTRGIAAEAEENGAGEDDGLEALLLLLLPDSDALTADRGRQLVDGTQTIAGAQRGTLDDIGVGPDSVGVGDLDLANLLAAAHCDHVHPVSNAAAATNVEKDGLPAGPEDHGRDGGAGLHLVDGGEGGLRQGLLEQHLVARIRRGRSLPCCEGAIDVGASNAIEESHGENDLPIATLGTSDDSSATDFAGNGEGDVEFGGEPDEFHVTEGNAQAKIAHLQGHVGLWEDVEDQSVSKLDCDRRGRFVSEHLGANFGPVLKGNDGNRLGCRRAGHDLRLGWEERETGKAHRPGKNGGENARDGSR